MKCPSLILLAHGSRDPKWCKSFEHLLDACCNPNLHLAYMDLIQPSLSSVIKTLVKNRIKKIKILPMFMADGRHVDKDIPKQVKELEVRFPEIDFEILPSIGEHPELISSMKEIIRKHAQEI